MKKSVVLLAINSKFIHSNPAVWLIKAGVEAFAQAAYDVNVVEATIHQSSDEIADEVSAFEPDIIGVSTYIWNASMLPDLLYVIRKRLPDIQIILGGPEAENNMEHWLSNGADYVLAGKGEYTFPAFLNGNIDLPIEMTNKSSIELYTDEYVKAVNNRIIYFESSRGCPFNCSYCMSAETNVEFFPLETVKEQLSKLAKLDSKSIKFVDRTFNCNQKRAYELFEYVIALDTNCNFHFEVAADLFDMETINLLSTAPPGRIQLEIGLQSFHKPTLEAVSRKTDIKKAAGNITDLLKGKNMHIHIDLIAGLPFEDLKDFKKSFEKAYKLNAHTLQLGFLKLLHGSVLRRQVEKYEIAFSQTPPYEIQSSPWLSADDIKTLKQAENALQHTYNKCRFLRTIKYVLSVSKVPAFAFYQALGEAAPNHGTALDIYAEQIFAFCANLPNVDFNDLHDHMVCDWLSMVKGKNMPTILRNTDSRRKQVFQYIKEIYDHEIRRDEVRVLKSGKSVFVNNTICCPITGLYEIELIS